MTGSAAAGMNDISLLGHIADDIVVGPGSQPSTDSTTTPVGGQWTFTRTRRVLSPIRAAMDWYRANQPGIAGEEKLTRGQAAFSIARTTEAGTAARTAFDGLWSSIRFTDLADGTTSISVVVTGYHREPRVEDSYLPAGRITSAHLDWTDTANGTTGTRSLDVPTFRRLVDYINHAQVKPLMTYTGTAGGIYIDLTLNDSDGKAYTAHWDTAHASAGLVLDLPSTGSQLLAPDWAFFTLLKQLATR